MIDPPRWTPEQLDVDRNKATEVFRQRRMKEPLEDYLQAFDSYQGSVKNLFEITVDLEGLDANALDILTDSDLLHAFCYLSGPPISQDDLKTLAEAASLNQTRLRNNPEMVSRIVRVLIAGIDRRRFPWVLEGAKPDDNERHAAILASAALMATQRVSTQRRNEGKTQQESAVLTALTEAGLVRVHNRTVDTSARAPAPGQFCGESMLGTRKADVIVRLWDHRIMPIECKVSNSATNSVKRLNNDAAVKAAVWTKDFGATQVVPCAVLSGVYKLHNLLDAQQRGLTIFWAHDLQAMLDWIETTQSPV